MALSRRSRPTGSFRAPTPEVPQSLIPATGYFTVIVPDGNSAPKRQSTTGSIRSRLVAIPSPGNVTIQWIERKILEHTDPKYAINRLFYDGDHWQDGMAWTGPMPPTTDPDYSTIRSAIIKSFVSKNCVAETTNRKAEGAVGREPSWRFTSAQPLEPGAAPPPALTTLTREVETALTTWWDTNDVPQVIKEVVVDALLGGRACVRLFIPPSLVPSTGTVDDIPTGDIAAALKRIFIHSAKPTEAAVLINKDNMQPYGVYTYRDENNTLHGEVVFTDGLDDDANTVIVQVKGQEHRGVGAQSLSEPTSYTPGNEPNPPTAALNRPNQSGQPDQAEQPDQELFGIPLGGRLTIFELEVPKLITDQVLSQQKAINKALTMGDRNSELGGFLERTILNGQMPGHYEDDPARPGKKKFIRDPYETGGAAVNFIRGVPQYDNEGAFKGLANPSIVYRDPVSPKTFQETYMLFYTALLQEVSQVHYLLAGEQYASGESRKQARSDFEKSLRDLARSLNAMLRWMLECTLAYAAYLANSVGAYDEIRAVANTRIDPGPATADTITSAISLRDAGGLSREGMMEEAGIDDVDAEITRIEQEEAAGVVPPSRQLAEAKMKMEEAAAQAERDGSGVGSGRSTGRRADPNSARSQRKDRANSRPTRPS